ncbi:MAG: OadG family protein [Candidatus Aegiribacteria sp.]|nr:OadG family protein [Candidatus Aegiribacteria sp.]
MIIAATIIQIIIQAKSTSESIQGGLGIALVGMITVFTGLVCLSFFLPALEKWVEDGFGLRKKTERSENSGGKTIRRLSPHEIAAVSAAIHAHFCFLDQIENMKLTWETHEKPYSPWRLAGKAEQLQKTGSLWNRSRENA